jgi:hypothetical protein
MRQFAVCLCAILNLLTDAQSPNRSRQVAPSLKCRVISPELHAKRS